MKRKSKLFVKPKKSFEKERIEEENALRTKYGLKNKKEIWKTLAKINYFRGRAKVLARSPMEEQQVLFNKLKAIGLKTDSIADVLDLKVEDLLNRRLQTIVTNLKLANTPRQARQMVVHKKILVDGKVVDSPSFIVPVALEKAITVKVKKKKPKLEPKPAEAPAKTPAEVPKPAKPAVEQKAPEEQEEKSEAKQGEEK